MGRKLGSCATLDEGELGPHLKQRGQGRGLPVCWASSSSNHVFGHSMPTLHRGQNRTDRQTDRSTVRPGEPFYIRSSKNETWHGGRPRRHIVL